MAQGVKDLVLSLLWLQAQELLCALGVAKIKKKKKNLIKIV